MKYLLVLLTALLGMAPSTAPEYSIQAIRYATIPDFPLAALMIGAPETEKVDIAMVVWLIRGGGRVILFDSGFHRDVWFKTFPGITEFVRPDEAVKVAGVKPEEVTDIIVSHAHWDHMGGIDPADVKTLVQLGRESIG